MRTSVHAHPGGCCCRVYKGTASPHTPCTPPKDAAVGLTRVLPLPRHPVHPQRMLLSGLQGYCLSPDTRYTPKGCCCRAYKGTASPQTPGTPPKDAAVGFTKVLPLPRHPVHPQRMLLSGLQGYCLSPDTRYTPKGCCCRVYKGTASPQTPGTPPKDAAVGLTRVLPLPRHPVLPQGMLLSGLQGYYLSLDTRYTPKGCCCRVYKGTASPQTPGTPPKDAAVGFTRVLPLPRHLVHPQRMLLSGLQGYCLSPDTRYTPKGCCCRVYKGTASP